MFKLIIIDLDDTIVNYTYANKMAFDLLLKELSVISNHTIQYLVEKHKEIKHKLYQSYDKQFIRHDKLLQLKLLCNNLGIRDIKIIQNLYDKYETNYLDNLTLYDKCFEFLNLCMNKGIKVSIMTNNLLPIQLKVCNKFGLNIDTLFTSNEFIFEKPHEDCLNYIINYYGYNKSNILIIGDSIENDINWGKNNDVKTFLCDNKSKETSFYSLLYILENEGLST